MQTVTVVRIEPIGGGTDTDDASITLRCGTTEVTAFLFGCVAHVGDILQVPLSALDGEVRAAYLEDWPADVKKEFHRESIEKTEQPYGYRGYGHVVDQERGIIEILGFRIDVGDLDFVPNGTAVEFECSRLDMRRLL
ncbi:hypothetical protein [Ralstonia pickettii]|uniref:hypothetical protein n=1 Tax=Ralstonia pickettii TaxID=329 RepID=UPI0015BFC6B2|nr:hypothetical protein [Ralstonia pickettii]NWK47566.1 hypothetical protein [Ralstonia pickettii]